MKAGTTIGLACGATLALVILPSVASHFHLYADGSYFLAQLLRYGVIDANGHTRARIFQHLVTQGPVLLAQKAGILDLRVLSWTYGLSLFCLPWACYLAAAVMFLRAGMTRLALLVTIAYCGLLCLTGFFACHEAHLAAALFVLSLAVVTCCNPARCGVFVGLLAICVAGLSCYEFWVAFFPTVFVLFSLSTRRLAATRIRTAQRLTLLVLCAGGSVWNAVSIVFTEIPEARNSLLSVLRMTWPLVIVTCVLFGALCGVSGICSFDRGPSLRFRILDTFISRMRRLLGAAGPSTILATLVLAVSPIVYFPGIVDPCGSYALRSLNLLIPLMLAATVCVAVASGKCRESPGSSLRVRVLQYCLVGLLALTVQSHLYHTIGWRGFWHRLVQATQLETGYVPVGELRYFDEGYGWGWTYPAMSILFPGIEGKSIKAIVFNPKASWQPFGPSAEEDARSLAGVLRVPFEVETR